MTTIALLGFGRMGKKVLETATTKKDFEVLFAIDAREDAQTHSIPVISPNRFEETIRKTKPDTIIDFSHPTATMAIAPLALSQGISMVTCTTGFSPEQLQTLRALSGRSDAALLLSPNITPGINVLIMLTKVASKILPRHDIQITDYHFKAKADRPSGTALKLAEDLKAGGRTVDVFGVRAGNIVGTHTVLFAGERDQIVISHQSYTKDIFAESALDAAKALSGRQGYLEMTDILDFQQIFESYCDKP